MATTLAAGSDQLIDIIKRSALLKEVHRGTRSREELERRLNVSSATYYRYIDWLCDSGLAEESSEGVTLTPAGEVITEEVIRFETAVLRTLQQADTDRDLLLDVIRYAPGLEALLNGPRDRRALERQLDVSQTTSYRVTRSFEDLGLIQKSDGGYALTAVGEEVREVVATFETNVRTAVRIGPVLDEVHDTTPVFDLNAFAEATVTTTTDGDPHSPLDRYIRLLEKTDSLRGMNCNTIAPSYIGDIRHQVVKGMDTVDIETPEMVAKLLAKYPEKALEACASDHLTLYLHDDLPFCLVITDDRVAIGVLETDTRRLQMFVDTDSPEAREWAEAVFESYKADAVRVEEVSPWGIQRAVERGSLNYDTFNH